MQLCMEKFDARKLSTETHQQLRNQTIRLKKPEEPTVKSLKLPGFIVRPPANDTKEMRRLKNWLDF